LRKQRDCRKCGGHQSNDGDIVGDHSRSLWLRSHLILFRIILQTKSFAYSNVRIFLGTFKCLVFRISTLRVWKKYRFS
jgi:hypothetical protein